MIRWLLLSLVLSSQAHAGNCSDFFSRFLGKPAEVLPFQTEEEFREYFSRGGTFVDVTAAQNNGFRLGIVVDTGPEGRIQMFDLTRNLRLTPDQMNLEIRGAQVLQAKSKLTGETFWVKQIEQSRHVKAVLFDSKNFERLTVESLLDGPFLPYQNWQSNFVSDVLELSDGSLLRLRIVKLPQQLVFELKPFASPPQMGVVIPFRKRAR